MYIKPIWAKKGPKTLPKTELLSSTITKNKSKRKVELAPFRREHIIRWLIVGELSTENQASSSYLEKQMNKTR